MHKFFFFVSVVAVCLSGCATGGARTSADIDREIRHNEYQEKSRREIMGTINSAPAYRYTPTPMPTYQPINIRPIR